MCVCVCVCVKRMPVGGLLESVCVCCSACLPTCLPAYLPACLLTCVLSRQVNVVDRFGASPLWTALEEVRSYLPSCVCIVHVRGVGTCARTPMVCVRVFFRHRIKRRSGVHCVRSMTLFCNMLQGHVNVGRILLKAGAMLLRRKVQIAMHLCQLAAGADKYVFLSLRVPVVCLVRQR